jgi:hypothetical protein
MGGSVSNATSCIRIDEDEARGGFVFTSTIPGNDAAVFYTYEEAFHFFERVKIGYFDAVADRARLQALRFGAAELTPLTAEHAAGLYLAPENMPRT